MLAFGTRVGPDLFAYAPICPEVGPLPRRWVIDRRQPLLSVSGAVCEEPKRLS
jgi:hypothetical protein